MSYSKVGRSYEYNREDELGRGAQATVFRGRHVSTREPVAVKEYFRKNESTERELSILKDIANLKSSNILKMLDYEEKLIGRNWTLLIVTEFCNGGNIKDYMEENGPFDSKTTWFLLKQFASALRVLVDFNVVHRDLKPENILLSVDDRQHPSNPSYLTLKLADLGIARFIGPHESANTVCGTLAYMSPEILLSEDYDQLVDMWSFGVIGYYCYTQRHPLPDIANCGGHRDVLAVTRYYQDSSRQGLNLSIDGVPEIFADLMLKILVVNPRNRMTFDEFFDHDYFREHPSDDSDEVARDFDDGGHTSRHDYNPGSSWVITSTSTVDRHSPEHELNDRFSRASIRDPSLVNVSLESAASPSESLTAQLIPSSVSQTRPATARNTVSASSTPTGATSASPPAARDTMSASSTPIRVFSARLPAAAPLQESPAERKLRQQYNLIFDKLSENLIDATTLKPFKFDVYNGDKKQNQQRYDAIGEIIAEIVYERLEALGLAKFFVPQDDDVSNSTDPRAFVFITPGVRRATKLIVVIQGGGNVRAGLWSRKVVMNKSLSEGSMLPYVEKAKRLGYDLVILNPNQNKVVVNGVARDVQESGTPEEHCKYVWRTLIGQSSAPFIAVVAHSSGGNLVDTLIDQFSSDFRQRVKALALTDASETSLSERNKRIMTNRCMEWKRSDTLTGTIIGKDSHGTITASAGTNAHEETSNNAIDDIFKFFENKYEGLNSSPQKSSNSSPRKSSNSSPRKSSSSSPQKSCVLQ